MLVQDGFLYLIVTRHKLTVYHISDPYHWKYKTVFEGSVVEPVIGYYKERFFFDFFSSLLNTV
jgi:hypothetical protein